MNIRTTSLDKLFSQLVRLRAGRRCEACGKASGTMDCAHVLSRRHVHTRWDLLNAVCLCRGCHLHYTPRPFDWVDWCNKRLGSDTVQALRERAACTDKLIDAERIAIGEDLMRRIRELGEEPVCGIGRRLAKKRAKKRSKKKRSRYKRKVSGEVVLREGR